MDLLQPPGDESTRTRSVHFGCWRLDTICSDVGFCSSVDGPLQMVDAELLVHAWQLLVMPGAGANHL